MTKKKQPKTKPERVTVVFHDVALIARIDEWGAANRRHTRSNAIEALVAAALDSQPAKATG